MRRTGVVGVRLTMLGSNNSLPGHFLTCKPGADRGRPGDVAAVCRSGTRPRALIAWLGATLVAAFTTSESLAMDRRDVPAVVGNKGGAFNSVPIFLFSFFVDWFRYRGRCLFYIPIYFVFIGVWCGCCWPHKHIGNWLVVNVRWTTFYSYCRVFISNR